MEKNSMYGASHIAPRNGVYQFSRRIPKDIVEGIKALPPEARARLPEELFTYLAKDFVRFSLRTRDKATAKSLGTKADFEFDTTVQRVKEWLARGENSYDVVDPDLIRAIAQRWVSQELKEDDEKRLDSSNAYDLIHVEKGLYMMELDFQKALSVDGADMRDAVAIGIVRDLQTQYQLRLDPGGSLYAPLHREVLLGYLKIYEVVKRRNAGKLAPTPIAPPFALKVAHSELQLAKVHQGEATLSTLHGVTSGEKKNQPTDKITLDTVVNSYIAKLPSNHFKRKVRRCLQLFSLFMGSDTAISEIRQKKVTDYMCEICKLPFDWARRFDKGESVEAMLDSDEEHKGLSPVTWEQAYRAPLGTFFTAAMRDYGDDGFPNLTVDGIHYLGTRKAEEG